MTTRENEATPLLSGPRPRRRSVWRYILASAFSLGLLLMVIQGPHDQDVATPLNSAVSLQVATEDAAFLQGIEEFKDPTTDPCQDFYQYACGGWLNSHDIPTDRASIDASFYVVSERNKQTIRNIFNQKPPQIGELYSSCLNDQEVDAEAVQYVAEWIDKIHAVDSTTQLLHLAGEMDQTLGISTFFSVYVGADPQDPSTNILQLAQGGLTLPSREYYLEQSKVDAYSSLFVDYVTKLFAVGDLDKHNVSEYAQAVLETEIKLAKVSLPNAALRNPWTTSTAYPYAEIAVRYPFVMAYLNGIYDKEPFPMLQAIIATPAFFDAQNELLKVESLLPHLKNYMSFHLIDSLGAVLGEYFRRASHDFHGAIQGAGTILPRDQFCMSLTTAFLGEQLGVYYMQDVFGPDAKAAAEALVTEIEESLKALLGTEAWLDKITYEAAVTKLNMVKNYIGGPDVVPPLPFALQADNFFSNVRSLMQLSAAETIQAVNKPVNPQAWDMFPSTVNAYYDPSANKMVFPAAILQPPFYSADHFPAAANFARIGMVMGHELSHGFDDQGRNYDGTGALRSWWTPAVSGEFAEKAQCLSAQYSSFPVVSTEDGHVMGTINGNLTLGENIADNGGIHLAYEAYQLWKSTFAPSGAAPGEPEPQPKIPEDITPTPPEPEETIPAVVPGPEERTPEPTVAPPPIIPVPNEPVPETPPIAPVPDTETPAPAETEPTTPPAEPEPTPGEIIPEDTPQPPQEPDTEPPTPPPAPTEPVQTQPLPLPTEPAPVPTPPAPEEPTAPPPPAIVPISEVPTPGPAKPSESPSPETTPEHHRKASDTKKHKKSDNSDEEGDEEGSEDHKHSSKRHEEEHSSKKTHEKHSEHKKEEEGGQNIDHEGKHHEKDTKQKKHSGHGYGSAPDEGEETEKHGKKHGKDEDGKHSEKHHHPNREENEHGRHKDAKDEGNDEPEEGREGKHDHDRHGKEHEEEGCRGCNRHEKYKHEHHGHGEYNDGHHESERHPDERGGRRLKHHHPDEEREERKEERREEREEREERKREEWEERHQRKEERKEEKREERRERREEREKEREDERERRHRHRHEWEGYDCGDEGGCRHHHRHDKDAWERYECGDEDSECGRHHKWLRPEGKYPFSGGNLKIHSMVARLARSLVQPNDPVADDRLFFTAFAQNWCEKRSPAYAELLRMIDPHSPGKWRVNGPLMNYGKFAEVFNCPVGSPMNPEKKCVIW